MNDLDSMFERVEAAQKGSFGVIPAKTKVKVKVIEQKFAYSSQKNTPGVKVVLEVGDGDYAGKRIWHDFWLTEKNLPFLKRDLATLGFDGKLSTLASETCQSLIGLGAEVTVDVEEYEAKNKETGQYEKRQKNRVAFWNNHWSPPQDAVEETPSEDAGAEMEPPF
jgi:hypothetical protein